MIKQSRGDMLAIQVSEYGGPEVLKIKDIQIGRPGAGQALVRI
jgi:NADPH:quinone reductase-like Zn-dependent oxidoreductase